MAGEIFESGIGILANSRLEVRSDGYRRLTAKVGIDDSASDMALTVTFQVFADGKLVGSSPS